MRIKLFFLALIIGLAGLMHSCKILKKSSKIKEAEKQEIARKKEEEKQYNLLIEAHQERQTELTKERMKETKKRSEYYNQAKKRTLFQRIFGNKQKQKKPKKRK